MRTIQENCLADQLTVGQEIGVVVKNRQEKIMSACRAKVKSISTTKKQITLEHGTRFASNGYELGRDSNAFSRRCYLVLLDDEILEAISQTDLRRSEAAKTEVLNQQRSKGWQARIPEVEKKANSIVNACIPELEKVLKELGIDANPEQLASVKSSMEAEVFYFLKTQLYK